MNSILTAILVIGAGAAFFGWHDLFHAVTGIPSFLIGFLFFQWWKKRTRLEGEEEYEHEQNLGRQITLGSLGGLLSLLLFAGVFSLASRTPLYNWLYDPDCTELLETLRTLTEGQAHARIVQVADEQQQQHWSSACSTAFTTIKTRALIEWAAEAKDEDRLRKLKQAREEAEEIENSDLLQLIDAKIQVEQVLEEMQNLQLQPYKGKRGIVVNLSDILFEPGEAELKPAAWKRIQRLAEILVRSAKGKKVKVEGHTDAVGNAAMNQKLSEARAKNVAQALMRYGVTEEQLVVTGYGEQSPLASNDTSDGREKNRRVEVIITD